MHEKPTTDMVAYDLYLRALEIERNRASSFGSGGAEGAKRELDLLDQAVTRDPTFVLALCKLASVHLYLYWLTVDQTPARLDAARKALEAAARLQPDGGEVQVVMYPVVSNLFRLESQAGPVTTASEQSGFAGVF